MNIKVKAITVEGFKKKFKVKDQDPWSTGVFTVKDIETLKAQSGFVPFDRKLIELVKLIPVFLQEPVRIIKNIRSLLKVYGSHVFRYYSEKKKNVKETFPFSDYALKATIIASFNPKRLLEIGTDRGWAITAFKSVLPECQCYTMEYRHDQGAGIMVKKKPRLKIKQIWANSLNYNYDKIAPIDVSYIDGNHHYDGVYADLVNCNIITRKVIILDDYIPGKKIPRDPSIAWADYFLEVVEAVGDFLRKYGNDFSSAFWLKNTRVCILIKK